MRFRKRLIGVIAAALLLPIMTYATSAYADSGDANTASEDARHSTADAGYDTNNEQDSRLITDYYEVRSILFAIFQVDSEGNPQNGEYTGNVDIDNYYGTVFTYQSNDGRRHELIQYQPRDGGEIVWGWNYEYARDGDAFHETNKRLYEDAAVPPSDTDIQVAQMVEYDLYAGRIWCTWGRDMVMVTNDMIAATAGVYKTNEDLSHATRVFVEAARTGADLIIDGVYDDPPPGDYCSEETS